MGGSVAVGIVLVVIVLAGIMVLGVGGFATTTTTSTFSEEPANQVTVPPADGSHGLVVGRYQSKGGLSILGWNITPSKWEAQVMFVPPAECMEPENEVVVAEGPCATVPAVGARAGGGTDPEGNRLWTVSFEVSKECHDALEYNDEWPTTKPECARAK